jgi:hypothetical protein
MLPCTTGQQFLTSGRVTALLSSAAIRLQLLDSEGEATIKQWAMFSQ